MDRDFTGKYSLLVNDAMSDGSTYWNEAMWSNNTVTLKPETTSTWTYNSTTGRYESESFCPYFKDIYGYTGRNVFPVWIRMESEWER